MRYEIKYRDPPDSKKIKIFKTKGKSSLLSIHALYQKLGRHPSIVSIERVYLDRCSRCLKRLDKRWPVHVCTPTPRFRKMEDRILELEAAVEKLSKP